MRFLKVCVPAYGVIRKSTYESILNIDKNIQQFDSSQDFYIQTGTYVDDNRNKLIIKSNQKKIDKYEWFLFVDGDISFNSSDIVKLIECGYNIISGAYLWRDKPEYYCAGYIQGVDIVELSAKCKGIMSVDFVGAGFLLVNRNVFLEMKYPYFRNQILYNNGCERTMREDIGFCLNAKNYDFSVNIDCNTIVTHDPIKNLLFV